MKLSTTIKDKLAEFIGADSDDIKDDDMLLEDLHMSASDVSDFYHDLENEGLNIGKIDFSEIQTVEDLVDSVSEQEEG